MPQAPEVVKRPRIRKTSIKVRRRSAGLKFLAVLAFFFSFFNCGNMRAYEGELTREEIRGTLEKTKLNEIFEQYLATIEMYDPERATFLGVHGSDALLTRRNRETANTLLDALKKLRSNLKKIDKDSLYPSTQTDYDLLDHIIETDIYNLQNMDIIKKRPQYYLRPLFAIYAVLSVDFENYNVRAANALNRIKLFPQILLEAERNLSNPPKIWTLKAIKQTQDSIDNIYEFLPLFRNYTRYDPILKTHVNEAMGKAKTALEKYRDFLKEEILPSSDGDFRVGKFAYGFYLERWHGLNMTPRKALSIAKKEFKNSMAEMETEAKNLSSLTYAKEGWKAVLANFPKEHPKYENIIRAFHNELERAYQHFDEFKIVEFPQQRILIKKMPGFMKSMKPYVYYMPSFGLDDTKISQLFINIPDKKLAPKRLEAILKNGFNFTLIQLLVAHSLMPGLHLQNWEANKNPSRIRKISYQPFINSGWALYSERLADEMGFYTSYWTKFMRLYLKALRAFRAYVDASLHQKNMTYAEAVNAFMDKFYFTREQAQDEVLRISETPTESFGCVLVYERILKLRKAEKKGEQKYFNLRKFHTNFLMEGNIPINEVERELKLKKKEENKIVK